MKPGFTEVEERRGFQKRTVWGGMSSLLFRTKEGLHYPSFSHSFILLFIQYFLNTCQVPGIALGIADSSEIKVTVTTHGLNEET